MKPLLLLASCALLACHARPTPDGAPAMPAQVSTPSLADVSGVQAWLNASAGEIADLPVSVAWSVLGVEGGLLGEVPVQLDTTRLGIALPDRLRGKCASPCHVWLRCEVGQEEGAPLLIVNEVQELVAAGELLEIRAR